MFLSLQSNSHCVVVRNRIWEVLSDSLRYDEILLLAAYRIEIPCVWFAVVDLSSIPVSFAVVVDLSWGLSEAIGVSHTVRREWKILG